MTIICISIFLYIDLGAISTGYNALFWFVAGLFASILVSVATRLSVDAYYRPILEIIDCKIIKRGDNQRIRVKVRNSGRRVANNCSISAIFSGIENSLIKPTTSSEIQEPDIKPPIRGDIQTGVAWKDNDTTRELNRGEIASFDICELYSNEIIIASEDGLCHPSVALSNDNKYNITISITSANSTPCSATLNLRSTPTELSIDTRT